MQRKPRGPRRPGRGLGSAIVVAILIAAPAATRGQQADPSLAGQAVRLAPLVVRDAQINNIEAFRMLVPQGWRSQGGVVWMHDRSNLAAVSMLAWNPDGGEALQVYPSINYTWSDRGYYGFPEGSNYLGNIVARPLSPVQYVDQLLPSIRPGIQPRLVDHREMRDVAQTLATSIAEPSTRKTVSAERIRIAYYFHGVAYEEDFYVAIAYTTSPVAPGTTLWTPVRLYSFRAPAGQLNARSDVMHAMVSSVRVSPEWLTEYLYVVQLFNNRQAGAIRSAGELSRYIARASDEIREINRSAYENQQRTYDRVNRQFSNYVRGVDQYANPYTGNTVDLPSSYRDVWVSESGEYLLSNNANLDPNVGSTVGWQRMQSTPLQAQR
ncbi:MAG: hypothetical protein GC159_06830 [Phycisphaera sp.]|nr:hypothetical protein [Phycisphaera sp.]